jgi:hypothetical protein
LTQLEVHSSRREPTAWRIRAIRYADRMSRDSRTG